jgi:hypothetical protein
MACVPTLPGLIPEGTVDAHDKVPSPAVVALHSGTVAGEASPSVAHTEITLLERSFDDTFALRSFVV